MRKRWRLTSGMMRSTVSPMREGPSPSGNSCLGLWGVETGQKREPTPPASTTAQKESSAGEEFVDSGKEFFGAEGLRQEIGGTQGSCLFAIGLVTLRGEHDYR